MIRVLYQVLENYPWSEMDEYLMLRLLTMFHTSIMTENDNFEYASLRRGIEVCLRHILANLPSEQLLNVVRPLIYNTLKLKKWFLDQNNDAMDFRGANHRRCAFGLWKCLGVCCDGPCDLFISRLFAEGRVPDDLRDGGF